MDLVVYLLTAAWLLPLACFITILVYGPRLGCRGWVAGVLASVAIGLSFACALTAAGVWFWHHPPHPHGKKGHIAPSGELDHHSDSGQPAAIFPPTTRLPAKEPRAAFRAEQSAQSSGDHEPSWTKPAIGAGMETADESALLRSADITAVVPKDIHLSFSQSKPILTGDWYTLAEFGPLRLTIGFYVDTFTVLMILMVTFVASCIHVYSLGYMHEELHPQVKDPELLEGDPLQPVLRPGRYARFFQYLSLFCWSMIGLVLANNLFMIFVFWELVGICSYLLIGFYRERPSAIRAATKAFVVNRVGDFGMVVGLAALWGAAGTLAFVDQGQQKGIFSQAQAVFLQTTGDSPIVPQKSPTVRQLSAGKPSPEIPGELTYTLLIIGGLGIFCGCVGKSAQFPLHVWLPDAMEGPTPVSALIHAATMVAAGVYLVGRFYPALAPELLFTVAVVGLISALLAGTMALVASEIKRVLAFSTISQLGFMMFALGIGGWVAGLFHLLTHAFFKALLFLAAGSVIHGTGTGELSRLGGLARKMPWTAATMLVGCLAIAGAGVPMWIGLSGFHSKDAIMAQALLLALKGATVAQWFFAFATVGVGLTAVYMFRLWYLTFLGLPRDPQVAEHAHESPAVMVGPLVVLGVCSVVAGWAIPGLGWGIAEALEEARPAFQPIATWWTWWQIPAEAESHGPFVHVLASWVAFAAAVAGFLVATVLYGLRVVDTGQIRRRLWMISRVLERRYFIDDFYQWIFVRGSITVAQAAAFVDKVIIDGFLHLVAQGFYRLAKAEDFFDRRSVDAAFDRLGATLYQLGLSLRHVQSGLVRHYLVVAVVGTIVVFVIGYLLWLAQTI